MSELLSSRELWLLTALSFIVAFVATLLLFLQLEIIPDTDSYFHLAVARTYWQQGFIAELDWARASVMGEHFGDKELGFHLLLVPFVALLDAQLAGAVALAFFNATLAAVIGHLAMRGVGSWGALLPLWLFATSAEFLLRVVRLRPELLSLILLLVASALAARRRYLALAALSMVYALSYTAFHALLGLIIGWGAIELLRHRRLPWRGVAYPCLGVLAGLILHPHFPDNLLIWGIQNYTRFALMGQVEAAAEFGPSSLQTIVFLNAGWFATLLVLWRAGAQAPDAAPEEDDAVWYFLLPCLAFTVLYLPMQRFAVYVVPFATLTLLFALRRRGLQLGRWVRLPWRGKVPLVLALGLCLLTVPSLSHQLAENLRGQAVFEPRIREDWRALAKLLPAGARVAAPWREAEWYVWAAPQARYLSLLDPVFTAVWSPAVHDAEQRLWNQDHDDVVRLIRTELDSEYVAFAAPLRPGLLQRLLLDPRAQLLHLGFSALFHISPDTNDGARLVRDLQGRPAAANGPPRGPRAATQAASAE